ncbi:DUF1080 domain-containing protein [soil metagenome]
MKKILRLSWCMLCILFVTFSISGFKKIKNNAVDNTLTDKEKKEGWQLLFNGQDLTNWKVYQNATSSSWVVQDGMLCSTKPVGNNPDLLSINMYENFELSADWKLSPEGNSGILYHVTEDHPNTYQSGPEYQLIDDDGFPEKIENYQKTGANYAMNAPSVRAIKPPNEWNHTVIIVNKAHVEHWLNGQKVVEYELWSDAWQQAKNAGKWKDEAGYGAAKKGYIAFQASHSHVENTGVCFKNIKIKIL